MTRLASRCPIPEIVADSRLRRPRPRNHDYGLAARRHIRAPRHREVRPTPRGADRSLYTPNDDSLNAVLMIALINFKVKHIIVAVS